MRVGRRFPPNLTSPTNAHVNAGAQRSGLQPSCGSIYNLRKATVTVCKPGTQICQKLDHVLVDTGSTGLRVLASELSTAVDLPRTTNESGLPLLNCAQFLDGSFMWGPVATADVYLGNKVAQNLPIQIAGNTVNPASC